MRLLAESRPGHRNTVRVLFYGQSITAQGWSVWQEARLRERFPHAELVVENRALGGYASQLLVKAAETDLYPFYPDLLIFHVYGAHDKYADIIRRTRERTTSEILLLTDHVTRVEDLTEPLDPARVQMRASEWSAFMNVLWLPSVAERFETAICDQRASWKAYLTRHHLAPSDLLRDEIHPNAHGDWLIGSCVNDCLHRDRGVGRSAAEEWVQWLEVGRAMQWRDDLLEVEFEGNRVDAVFEAGLRKNASLSASGELASESTIGVTIDGRSPSDWQELYGFTRAVPTPGGHWPAVMAIGSRARLQPERWTLLMTTLSRDPERYAFALEGSVTGADGHGRSDEPFVSRSGRIILEPDNWGVAYAMGLAGTSKVPDRFTIQWDVVPRGVDRFPAPVAGRPGVEPSVTLAQGLPPGRHTLRLRGPAGGLRGLRIYRPPLSRSVGSGHEQSPLTDRSDPQIKTE
ncbi:MAG: hypothetical protein QM778_33595 [Myxococcales bacterium]